MRKKITVLLLALCLVFLAACGAPSPTDALKAELEDSKASADSMVGDLGDGSFGEESTQALLDKITDFDCEFGEEKIDGDTATVEATITTYPFGEILSSVITEVLSTGLSSLGAMTEEEATALMDETLLTHLEKAEKTYKAEVTVTLKNVDGEWKVQSQGNEELANAMSGGLFDLISSFGALG